MWVREEVVVLDVRKKEIQLAGACCLQWTVLARVTVAGVRKKKSG